MARPPEGGRGPFRSLRAQSVSNISASDGKSEGAFEAVPPALGLGRGLLPGRVRFSIATVGVWTHTHSLLGFWYDVVDKITKPIFAIK